MSSDYDIMLNRKEFGRDSLSNEHKARSDQLIKDEDNAIQGFGIAMYGVGAVAAALTAFHFLPAIAFYLLIAAGAVAWGAIMMFWPRYGSLSMAVVIMAGFLFGIGSDGVVPFFWLDVGPVLWREDPMWDGPGTWAGLGLLSGLIFLVINSILVRRGHLPTPLLFHDGYANRPAKGPFTSSPFSLAARITMLTPLIIFLPLILWSGMFGHMGLYFGEELTRWETLSALMSQPLAVFNAGFHKGIFWPGGFLGTTAVLSVYVAVTLALIMGASYQVIRSRKEEEGPSFTSLNRL